MYKLHLKSSKSSIFLFLGIVLMPFFYFPVFFGFRIKKDYTNNCFFPFAFCSTVFLFLKNVFLLIKCVLLFVFDSLRTIDSKKNPANINFNKEPVQYTENRHRTRRL